METLKKRPTSVTVIGWIFIVISGLMILFGSIGLIAFIFIERMKGGFPPLPDDLPGSFKVISIMFQYFDLLLILQVLLGIFMLISGIQFLKLRAWARTALETVSWIGLIYVVIFGIFWIISWISIASSRPIPDHTVGPLSFLDIFGIVMGIVNLMIFGAPIIIIIKFLRGRTIKESVSLVKEPPID